MDLRIGRRMKRIALALTVGLLTGATAAAQGNGQRTAFSTLSNTRHMMAVLNQKEFVHLTRGDHGNCFGIKKRDETRFAFTCWDDFPSAAHPILDQSVFGAEAGEPIHVIQVDGFAADGIVEIDATDASGSVLARTPVIGNVYSLEAVPPAAVRLVALDAKGRPAFAVPR
jgi:hypothetical protein